LAAELNKSLGIEAKLIESSSEVFEVEYAGKLLFSKRSVGRLPQTGEVLELVKRSALFQQTRGSGRDDLNEPDN
jgi:hypothetical protein